MVNGTRTESRRVQKVDNVLQWVYRRRSFGARFRFRSIRMEFLLLKTLNVFTEIPLLLIKCVLNTCKKPTAWGREFRCRPRSTSRSWWPFGRIIHTITAAYRTAGQNRPTTRLVPIDIRHNGMLWIWLKMIRLQQPIWASQIVDVAHLRCSYNIRRPVHAWLQQAFHCAFPEFSFSVSVRRALSLWLFPRWLLEFSHTQASDRNRERDERCSWPCSGHTALHCPSSQFYTCYNFNIGHTFRSKYFSRVRLSLWLVISCSKNGKVLWFRSVLLDFDHCTAMATFIVAIMTIKSNENKMSV